MKNKSHVPLQRLFAILWPNYVPPWERRLIKEYFRCHPWAFQVTGEVHDG